MLLALVSSALMVLVSTAPLPRPEQSWGCTRRFSYRGLEAERKPCVTALITLTRQENTPKAAADIFFLFAFVF